MTTINRRAHRPIRNYYQNETSAKYLNDSILLYKGEPCRVMLDSVDDDGDVMLSIHKHFCFGSPLITRTPPDNEYLDLHTPPLGYINFIHPGSCPVKSLYIRRSPNMNWKQGITSNNILAYTIDGYVNYEAHLMTIIQSKSFYDSISGVFPTVLEGIERLKSGELTEVAVSRELAFRRRPSGMIDALYKTEEFAFMYEDQTENIFTSIDNLKNRVIAKNTPELFVKFKKMENPLVNS